MSKAIGPSDWRTYKVLCRKKKKSNRYWWKSVTHFTLNISKIEDLIYFVCQAYQFFPQLYTWGMATPSILQSKGRNPGFLEVILPFCFLFPHWTCHKGLSFLPFRTHLKLLTISPSLSDSILDKVTLIIQSDRWLERKKMDTVQFSCSVVSDSLQPMNRSMPGLPVHHQLREPTQLKPLSWWCHPPPALNLSRHQGLFKWVSSSHQVSKLLEFQLQHQTFQWTPRTDLP